jgi:two-component system NtrC family sensor kinase
MAQDIQSGKIEDALSAVSMMRANQEKIIHHGKRADGIVKSMLQHSRKGAGQKELTDINALASEYLNLAYHGFRAKDKTFNVDLKTSFDPALPKIEVVQQDIGRVLLNLITNAFYVLARESPKPEANRVTLTTQFLPSTNENRSKVKIMVADNGPGMPPDVLNKIFQPFFTTKPTGEGTGLGLSISFDIIKAHQGNISVDSKLGEGTVFTIELPVA